MSASRRCFLAAIGDVNRVETWSGTPYHLLQAAKPAGLIDEGLAFEVFEKHRQLRRYAWNLKSLLLGRGRGGYQFSPTCLERLWRPAAGQLPGARVINCFQLYPPSVVADERVERWYYIDQTLVQYYGDYGLKSGVSDWAAEDSLHREREGYRRAAGIVTHSDWARQSLVRDYGYAEDQIHVVVPGANLDAETYRDWAAGRVAPTPDAADPLRLVFVGWDGQRKGLDRLLRAFAQARQAGASLSLSIVGCPADVMPPDLRNVEGVQWLGFIDKQREQRRFLETVAAHDVGCLLSRAEAGGMCLREFHAIGLAVIGPQVGGSPDHVIAEAARLIPPEADDGAIAALLIRLSRDRAEVQRLREISWARREEVSWSHTISKLTGLWSKPTSDRSRSCA